MSNPYGNDPYGNDPYGNQGGQNPYGAPYQPGGYGAAQPAKTDGVSIAAFVLSLLCCTSLLGVILGFVGLSRTKNGQRKGRWAAISAIVIGLLGTLASVGGIIAVVLLANSSVTPDNAEVGQCVNIREDGDTIYLTKKDCSDDHDGEIVHVGKVKEIEAAANDIAVAMPEEVENITTDQEAVTAICKQLVGEDASEVGDDLTWGLALEDPDDPADSDPFICYVESSDKLDEPIL